MNGCEQHQERISAWLDGELAPPAMAELAQHLTGCAACRAVLAETAVLRAAMAAIEDPAPPALGARIDAMIDASVPRRTGALAPWLAAGAAAWALAASTLLALRPSAHTMAELMAVRDAALRPQATTIAANYIPAGYQLVGSRTDQVAGHAAHVFIFQRGTERVALCEWDAGSEPARAPRSAQQNGMTISYWSDGTTEFWVAGQSAPVSDLASHLHGRI